MEKHAPVSRNAARRFHDTSDVTVSRPTSDDVAEDGSASGDACSRPQLRAVHTTQLYHKEKLHKSSAINFRGSKKSGSGYTEVSVVI